MKKLLIASLSLVAILGLVGCSTDEITDNNTTTIENNASNSTTTENTSNTETTEINGKVADGYLVGARVCLDKNKNMICEDDEVNTITDDTGSYTLKIDINDKVKYPILVEVSEDVVDLDTNEKVNKSYKLMSMKPDFVSPFTTLAYVASMIDKDANKIVENNTKLFFDRYAVEGNISFDDYIANNDTSLHNIAKQIADLFKNNFEVVNSYMQDKNESDKILTAYLPIYFNIAGLSNDRNLTKTTLSNKYTQIQLYKSAKEIKEIKDKNLTVYLIKKKGDGRDFQLNSNEITDNSRITKKYRFSNIFDMLTDMDNYQVDEEYERKIIIQNNEILESSHRREHTCYYSKVSFNIKEADLSNIIYRVDGINKDISFKDGAKIYYVIAEDNTTYEDLSQFLDENSSSCIIKEVDEDNLKDFIENSSIFYPSDDWREGLVTWGEDDKNRSYKVVDNYLIIDDYFLKLKDNKLYKVLFEKLKRKVKSGFNKEAILDIISQYQTEEKSGDELVGKSLYSPNGDNIIFNEKNISINNKIYPAKVDVNYTFEENSTNNCEYKREYVIDKVIKSLNEYYHKKTDIYGFKLNKFSDEDEKYYLHEIIASQNIEDVVNSLDDNCVYKEDIEEDTLKDMIDNDVVFEFDYDDDWKEGKIDDIDYKVVTIDDEDYLIVQSKNEDKDRLYHLKDGNLTYIKFDYTQKPRGSKMLYNKSAYDKIK